MAALAVGLALPSFLLLIDVEAVAYDMPAYRESFAQAGAPAATGFSLEQLDWTMRRTLDYATGRRADLQFDRADADGGPPGRPAFSRIEIDHMADVRSLFGLATTCRRVALFVITLGGLAVILVERRQGLARLGRGLGQGAAAFLGAGALLAAAMLTGFSSFWTAFHETLFTNDLWLLPADSLLIQMLPESLFQRLALEIVGLLAVELSAILGLSVYLRRAQTRSGVRGRRAPSAGGGPLE
jgi:integral membrane protein (TIGR01906 family)